MPVRRYDAVVFDLDGTLCDSEPFIAAAGAEALRRRYGIVVERSTFDPFVGAGDDRFISGAAAAHGITSDVAVDKALMYEVYFEQIPGALQPVAGALAFIERLRGAGVRIGLATGGDRSKTRANLAAIGLDERTFDVVVTAEDVSRKKPHPEPFLAAVGGLGLAPARCLVVEDARNGVLAGRSAGCDVLGIASSQSAETLLEAGAATVVQDYTALPVQLLRDLGLATTPLTTAPPTTVVFDLGGVLLDWSPRHLYRTILPDDASIDAFLAEVDFWAWNGTLDAGRSWDEAVQDLATRHPSRRPLIEAFHARWPETLAGSIDDTVEVLREVRDAGVRILALSNWSAVTFRVARERHAFLDWFEGVVISGDVGVNKPDPRIYGALVEQFGVDPATALFIDDAPANVAAADRLGFQTVLFTGAEALRADLVARGLLPGASAAEATGSSS